MKINIAKYELYPAEQPEGVAVGYNVTTRNGRVFYIDTVVRVEDTNNLIEEEILAIAWDKLGPTVLAEVAEKEALGLIVGAEWLPPTESGEGGYLDTNPNLMPSESEKEEFDENGEINPGFTHPGDGDEEPEMVIPEEEQEESEAPENGENGVK